MFLGNVLCYKIDDIGCCMFVYLIENTLNGKRYVGKTYRALEIRWKEHVNGSIGKSMTAICCAIRKYGVDNFKISVLQETDDYDELNMLETLWIKKLNSLASNGHGYNLTLGGEGAHGYTHTVEAKKKISDRHKGKSVSDATRALIREAQIKAHKNPTNEMLIANEEHSKKMKGKGNPFYGKSWGRTGPLKEATKLKLSIAHTGKVLSENHKKNIGMSVKRYFAKNDGPNKGVRWPVVCLDNDGTIINVFSNFAEASMYLNIGVKLLRSYVRSGTMIHGMRICKLHKHSKDEFDALKKTVALVINKGNQ